MKDIVFGIDFGTTYTLISWWDEKIKFLPLNKNINDDINMLLSTEINNQKNLKRKLIEELNLFNDIDNENLLYKNIIEFFGNLNKAIKENFANENLIIGVKKCVLTVPARFNDVARNVIKSAAIQAGFHVVKLLAEPVAAAIYSIREKKTGYYIVYDLGGGTFDATLLKFEDNVFQILAIDGLANFGGIDIDNMLMEELKITNEEAIKYKHNGEFSNEIYQKIDKMLQVTYDIIEKILNNNELKHEQINNLILAGGSAALPMIKKHLSKTFDIAENNLRLDQIVCAGAAYYGAKIYNINDNSEHILIDAMPFNLGIETIGDKMEIIIPANTPIPVYKSQYFKPMNNNGVLINIVQSMSSQISDAISLAKFQINTDEPFEVIFMFDHDGILSIKIGQRVYTIANFIKNINKNEITNKNIEKLIEKVQNLPSLNNKQAEYMEYLKQASEIVLSVEALNWLESEFERLF